MYRQDRKRNLSLNSTDLEAIKTHEKHLKYIMKSSLSFEYLFFVIFRILLYSCKTEEVILENMVAYFLILL